MSRNSSKIRTPRPKGYVPGSQAPKTHTDCEHCGTEAEIVKKKCGNCGAPVEGKK